jgi:hypothetical protein
MPRTAKTPTRLVTDDGVDSAAAGVYTTIDSTLVTNGLSISPGWRGKLFLHVKNSAGSAKTFTLPRGTLQGAPPVDLETSVGAGGEQMLALGESLRFTQDDGSYHVDFESGFTGSIAIFATR